MPWGAPPRGRRGGISTAPRGRCGGWARSPPILTADAAGTGSSTSPRRRASRRSSSAASGGSRRSSTSPSGSPVLVSAVRSTSVRYRLFSPTNHEASLVALPDNTSSSPVANGSSVPAWPVRAPVRRRICATIANEDGPAGLSTSTSPLGLSARGGTRELAVDEVRDLFDRGVAREPGRLPVPAACRLQCERGDVDLVGARAQANAASGPLAPWRIQD